MIVESASISVMAYPTLMFFLSFVHTGNAAASGQLRAGDCICFLGKLTNMMHLRVLSSHWKVKGLSYAPLLWIPAGKEPELTRVEGSDLDITLGALSDFASSGASKITLVIKRLVKRATLQVDFTTGDDSAPQTTLSMLAGSNLRREMLRQVGSHIGF